MEKSEIRDTRIKKEKEMIQKVQNPNCSIEFNDITEIIEVSTEVHGFKVQFLIDIPEKYPFDSPKVSLVQSPCLTTLTEFSDNSDILEQILGESWLPVQNLAEVSEKLVLYAQQSFKPKDKALIIDIFSLQTKWSAVSVVLFSLLTRVSVIALPHFGSNVHGWNGEYEEYRHWMTITYNYEKRFWYDQSEYIPIRNPPINAYFCWILSHFSYWADKNSLNEVDAIGYFSASHKIFMRTSVILTEILFFSASLVTFFNVYYKNLTVGVKNATCAVLLISPCFSLISHVYFSYDIIGIGLILSAILMIIQDYLVISSMLIALAINFKIQNLVFLLPLVLGIGVRIGNKASEMKSHRKGSISVLIFVSEFIIMVASCLLGFIFICALAWWSWIKSAEKTIEILNLIIKAPEYNFELLPTVFSILNSFFPSVSTNVNYVSGLSSLVVGSPFLILLLTKRPYSLSLLYSLSGFTLTFYLFFYHEHLNFILMPLVPLVLLTIIDFPEIFRFISLLFALNIYPIIVQTEARSAYFGLSIFFYIVSSNYINTINYFQNRKGWEFKYWYFFFVSVHVLEIFSEKWFEYVRCGFVFISLICLWFWLLVNFWKLSAEMTQQYHVEKRFRKKNKTN